MPPPDADRTDDDVAGAVAVAAAAATAAAVEVIDLHDHAELVAVSALLDAVWGRPGEAGAVLVPEALAAIAHAGGQVTGAYRDGELLGATAAFLGRPDPAPGGPVVPFLHSHVTGVRDDVTATGIGTALKWHQRAWCLARGLGEVRWTFDPLIRRNLVFNLVHLGAQADRYIEDAYGRMPDQRNAGLPTDRLVVRWPLTSPRVEAAAAGRTPTPDVEALRRGGAEVVLDELDDGTPHVTFADAPRQLLRIPQDIERLRVTDPDLALAWSVALRTTLGAALGRGARVGGASRDGWVLLATTGGVTELADPQPAP